MAVLTGHWAADLLQSAGQLLKGSLQDADLIATGGLVHRPDLIMALVLVLSAARSWP